LATGNGYLAFKWLPRFHQNVGKGLLYRLVPLGVVVPRATQEVVPIDVYGRTASRAPGGVGKVLIQEGKP